MRVFFIGDLFKSPSGAAYIPLMRLKITGDDHHNSSVTFVTDELRKIVYDKTELNKEGL
jgi:hypothetical protein